ncbi:class III aminotransferase [[Clostridium] sordellii]|uniref:aminotransferase class III-fold pyridoxal phosphate-dependent enzyme n=1 Tax=Paraclostridium sordellii TaxID=1505 RepID=UPI0005DB1B32|nr:aminotransferase class III-fold pyridoxal phosphate-dependent enzyme [Paeniclostridium sordellii]CEP43285.1 class III aminotransferase [[Clostridium] sordellii] [Paeniclostridium sordellii]
MEYYNIPMGLISQKPYKDIHINKADKYYLIDNNNKKYIDLCSGLWNCSLGYSNEFNKILLEEFKNLLANGLGFLDIHSYSHNIYEYYAKELIDFCNDNKYKYNKVSYTNSGSECTELAIKYIKHLKGNKKILCFDKGYHGTYFGGMNISGIDIKTTSIYNPKSIDIEFLPIPKNRDDEEQIIEYIKNNNVNLGAFILEPVIGSGGILPLNEIFLNELLEVLKKHNIISIFDEIATGFYRTGNRFYFHLLKSNPDILLLSKGINNGILPFGTVLLTEQITNKLIEKKSYIEHFSTQNGNLLAIQSALTTLNYIKKHENKLIKNIEDIANIFNKEFESSTFKITGIGAMYSIAINDSNKLNRIIMKLKQSGILVYNFWNSDCDNGLSIFPVLLTDVNIIKKTVPFIKKQLEKSSI